MPLKPLWTRAIDRYFFRNSPWTTAFLLGLEQKERELTGIRSLKIRHNNVLGYYVETTPVHGDHCSDEDESDPVAGEEFGHRRLLSCASTVIATVAA